MVLKQPQRQRLTCTDRERALLAHRAAQKPTTVFRRNVEGRVARELRTQVEAFYTESTVHIAAGSTEH